MRKLPCISVIIVTHNSEKVIGRCLQAISETGYNNLTIIIVDSGSTKNEYLSTVRQNFSFRFVSTGNIGFSKANNLGYQIVDPQTEYVVFLNPDAFPEPSTFHRGVQILSSETDIGCLTGRLLGFDLQRNCPSGRLDSTGIFRKWYGPWYDRGQGEKDADQFMEPSDVPAVCGAFMFFRKQALDSVLINNTVFHPDFFLYKEDIELCFRIREAGWRLSYQPAIKVFHCRGWKRERKAMPYALRKMSAKNEILLYRLHPSPYMAWAFFKYSLVALFSL